MRGMVVGDVIRRLVGHTMAQQLSKAVEAATAPHQYALSTRAGTECVAHVLQVLTEMDPQTTIVSIDGVGAYDSISRKAMLEALMEIPGGSQALPHVRLFYGQPNLPGICGKMNLATSTTFIKERVENRETPSCPSSSHWVNTARWKPGTVDQWRAVVRGFWMTCTSRPRQTGWGRFTTFCRKSCTGIPESTSTLARLKSGTPLEFGHQRVTNWSGSHS